MKEELAKLWDEFQKELDEHENDPYRIKSWERREDFEAFMYWVSNGFFIN